MNKIDMINWGSFEVGKLFTIKPTKHYNLVNSRLMSEYGITPVVVNSSYNNGIGGYSEYKATEKGNIITFSDTTSATTIFYQKDEFIGYSHVQGMYPKEDGWTMNSLLFFLSVFKKAAYLQGFDYVNKFTRKLANKMTIKLPITKDEKIDFEYMEGYISNLKKISNNSVESLLLVNSIKNKKLDLVKWENFHIYDIFYIDSGNKFDGIKMEETNPEINFINRSGVNNGISSVVNRINKVDPYEEGLMTLALGGSLLGACFVQDKLFYTGQNVVVLKAKENITTFTKLFIATTITKEARNNYKAFEKELNKHVKTDFVFKLPAIDKNTPDYKYMDNYIRNLIENKKIKERIELF